LPDVSSSVIISEVIITIFRGSSVVERVAVND
jgi:hypothetical protein